MLLNFFLKGFIKVGTLNLIDCHGKSYLFSATPSPKITVRLHSKSIERRLIYSPSLALGEGYMDGELTVEKGDIYDLLNFCALNLQNRCLSLFQKMTEGLDFLRHFFHKKKPIHKSRSNVAHHYDLSEDLYRLSLDRDMQYSCAYFKSLKDNLETAQNNKKHHLAAKLLLKPGQKVLDIGSGWGGLAIFLAREAGVDVTGLTLSEEQHRVATERVKEAGLQNRVRFHLRDYRQETGKYDRIVSVGMFEHVGVKHYNEFFTQISSLLTEDGVALLHSIGCSTGPSRPNSWLNKYIFPGGYCPALSETLSSLEPENLSVTDIEVLHHHYAETLRHWRTRFLGNQDKVKKQWGTRFFRLWDFYLASCEVAFRKRGHMVFQIQIMKNTGLAPLTRDYIAIEEERKLIQKKKVKLSLIRLKNEKSTGN
ncbi:MAG TPA: cyclopropane-fatty-acyl-phospholipid synthase family protein [Alphaproteobacteria bacterium]|nr:cyclopropane-fatty-acyl-phospholipid synthase family protein [Alphaproteobacteria bacterium]